ncbi:MAG TPA: hypothetical protein VFW41_11990 [Gaiellaceae bacterium]|nr:hypothetical protein [Gaiellaceae bacterium]
MKRSILVLIVAMLAGGALATTDAAASTSQSPFTGTWQAIDTDGSLMTFTVGGAGSLVHVTLHDHHATSCVVHFGARGGNAVLQGTGTIAGSTLTFSYDSFRCENGISVPLDPGNSAQFFYDATTDTMFSTLASSGQDTTWYRIGKPLEPPTTP